MSATARFPARSVGGIAFVMAVILLSSGRLDYWQGWIFLFAILATAVASFWLLKDDIGLVAERLRPGKGMKWWDQVYFLLSTPLYFAAVAVAGIDAGRYHWSPSPKPVLYALTLVVFLLGQGLFLWAKKANPFFSSVARIQADRGQSVCRTGPYKYCRHPGYLGGLLFGLATPLVLGSYWALIPQVLAAGLLIGRTFLEDRMLQKDLLWYPEYVRAVRSRLFPGVW